jgi:hypothetical protein
MTLANASVRARRDPAADHAKAIGAPAFDAAVFDRDEFFAAVRSSPFDGSFEQKQVDGLNAILDKWVEKGLKDLRWLAYMLATTFHETAQTMQPIEEFGKGRGKRYGIPDRVTGKAYYGRGYVQLTWKANYETMGRLLNHDLVRKPELALRPDVAAEIMFEGMTTSLSLRGDFTGRSLEQYFNATTTDWVNARRIINGTDRAEKIAKEAEKFFDGLVSAMT